MKKRKATSNAGRLALVMVGTVIGAGFASGAEITEYFVQYGEAGFWSMGLAGILFFLGTFGTLKIAYEHGNQEYGAFIETIAGKWLGAVLDALVTFSMLLGYSVMLAGSDAVFLQQWKLQCPVGAIAMAASCAAALWRGSHGIMAVNKILTPILIGGILLVSLYGILTSPSAIETYGLSLQPLSVLTARPLENMEKAFGSAVVYASYNMLGVAAVLVGLSEYIHTKKEAAAVGGYAAVILMVLTFVLGLATFLNYDTIVNISIPALELLQNCGWGRRAYVFVLLGAMYTTAVSNGYGVINRIQAIWPIGRGKIWVIMTLTAFLLSRLGFTGLVAGGYRILGYMGSVQLVLIAAHCILKKENINGK